MAYRNYGAEVGFIVDKNGHGDFTTITAALAAASSGTDIFINGGTYTENLTLKAGVNLTGASSTPFTNNVTIIGKCTFSSAGIAGLSNLKLQTNGDFLLSVTGSVASEVILQNCFLNCTNHTGIQYTSSSTGSAIDLFSCAGDVATTGITLFSHSGAGDIGFNLSAFSNSGSSTTASNASAGGILCQYAIFDFPISTSSTALINSNFSQYQPTAGGINAIGLTANGTGSSGSFFDSYSSGTSSCVSIGAGATLRISNGLALTTNAHAITGAGTVNYACMVIPVGDINTSTTNKVNFYAGTVI